MIKETCFICKVYFTEHTYKRGYNSVSTCDICAEKYQKLFVGMTVSAFYTKELVYKNSFQI